MPITGSDPAITPARLNVLRLGAGRLGAYALAIAPGPVIAVSPVLSGYGQFTQLEWSSVGAEEFDVYFGTTPTPTLVANDTISTTYNLGSISSGTYYWRVVATNDYGSVDSGVMSFQVIPLTALLVFVNSAVCGIVGGSIRDELNEAPNSFTFDMRNNPPVIGDVVEVKLGGDTGQKLFSGRVKRVSRTLDELTDNQRWTIFCQDHSKRLTTLVRKRYAQQSATDIALDIISEYTIGFTAVNVQAGLPTVSGGTDFTDVPVAAALTQLAQRIGAYWYVDYNSDVHFFVVESTELPDDIDSGNTTLLKVPEISYELDDTQLRTRVYVQGGGSRALTTVPVGATIVPVEDGSWYSPSGGRVVSGPQRIEYSSRVLASGGAFVGSGVSVPSNAPTAGASAGSGLGTGDYRYKASYVTVLGETLAGPASTALAVGGTITAPSTPSAVKQFGGGLSSGAYQWKVTYVDANGGETTPSSASSSITMDDISNPGATMTQAYGMTGGSLDDSSGYQWTFTFRNGSIETLPATAASPGYGFVLTSSPYLAAQILRSGLPSPPSGFDLQFYRTEGYVGAAGPFKRMSGPSKGFTSDDGTFFYDTASDATLGVAPPSSSTAIYRSAQLTIPVSSNPAAVSRKIYRTVSGGSTFKLVTTIGNNTATSYTDTTADGSLGADAPSTNTTTTNRVNLTGIPVSPDAAVTSRKIYRTVANGSVYKLLTTIGNNSTTIYADSTADGSLGADEPSTNTSGVTALDGQVNAGSTSLPVSATGPFLAAGGWVRVQSQLIRYTGLGATSLTGVPTSGLGSILSSIAYKSEALAVDMLIGVPSSGVGSVLYDILEGEDVDILVTVNDTTAQSTQAFAEGIGDGVYEHAIIDRRLSLATAQAVGEAELSLFAYPIVTVNYATRDQKTRSGKPIVVDLPSVGLDATFTIQSVTIDELGISPDINPRFQVTASSVRFSFEDVLRRLQLQ